MATERRPDFTIVGGGNIIGVYVCSTCGAAILQRSMDETDRPQQHADWHRMIANRLQGR